MVKMFNILIYETDETNKKLLHDVLVSFAVARDTEIGIKWIKPEATDKQIAEISAEAHAAFLHTADFEKALSIGRSVCENNDECALVYYGSLPAEQMDELVECFKKMFPSRPIGFMPELSDTEVYRVLCTVSEKKIGRKLFVWETKGMQYRIPYDSILYFRSDRNYVYIKLKNGNEFSFLGKLNEVEERVTSSLFIRIHQSYLVNRSTIITVDKGRKSLMLNNGEELFISKAHYKETLSQ